MDIFLFIIAVLVGGVLGWYAAKKADTPIKQPTGQSDSQPNIKIGDIFVFIDTAENPFDRILVRVVDIKSGYVRYRYRFFMHGYWRTGSLLNSMEITKFLKMYKLDKREG